ncbi:MAG TPA: glycosyltransferase [Phycisphaerales bacterium]|nr:glycosyltransferase [Phycisphaerales bacterium]
MELTADSKVVDLFGLNVFAMRMDEVLDLCERHIKKREALLLGVVNAAKIVNSRRDIQLRKSLDETDIILADGLPIVWVSKLIGRPLPERIAGIDIMLELIKRSGKEHYSIYFLGATNEVVHKVAEMVEGWYPGVVIAGCHDGYFDESQEIQVVEEIKQSHADILFVAMGSPKKENFLRKWRTYMDVPVCHGVGGSFDVVAGVTRRAPHWMQQAGLEWFYRMMQEPRRLWKRYFVTNSIFIMLSIKEFINARLNITKLRSSV